MNLVTATVGDGLLRASSFTLPIGTRFANAVHDGQRVIVGIRPEHIAHAADGGIEAVVEAVEPIGHESIVYATAGQERITAIFNPESTPRSGEPIEMAIDSSRLHLFDAETEKAL